MKNDNSQEKMIEKLNKLISQIKDGEVTVDNISKQETISILEHFDEYEHIKYFEITISGNETIEKRWKQI